jgi:hypothetical protein
MRGYSILIVALSTALAGAVPQPVGEVSGYPITARAKPGVSVRAELLSAALLARMHFPARPAELAVKMYIHSDAERAVTPALNLAPMGCLSPVPGQISVSKLFVLQQRTPGKTAKWRLIVPAIQTVASGVAASVPGAESLGGAVAGVDLLEFIVHERELHTDFLDREITPNGASFVPAGDSIRIATFNIAGLTPDFLRQQLLRNPAPLANPGPFLIEPSFDGFFKKLVAACGAPDRLALPRFIHFSAITVELR